MKQRDSLWFAGLLGLILPVVGQAAQPARSLERTMVKDPHSYANPEHVRVRHLDLSLEARFASKTLKGEAILTVERVSADHSQPLVLDTRSLEIEKAEVSANGTDFQETARVLGVPDKTLGAALTIALPAEARFVRISYATRPEASALQWLDAKQTAGRTHPFLFTQSQAINARSWIPLQDSPGVRITYRARIRTPAELTAVMSATNDTSMSHTGDYRFAMTRPIPSYLIALTVGDLAFHSLSHRTGVYAEPGVVKLAAAEFTDMEAMVHATEQLYGPYRWERYDVLVLPPSFPFGGMENPRLTFATPTVLAGDKSLVSLVAHELAHSWSGNLVTNATWSDFWLNEGFTVYLERRIVEKVFGKERAAMEAVLGRQELEKELKTLPANDQILHIDLKGRDPDDAVTSVPYEKGFLFLTHLESVYGRERFDRFLKGYFDHFAFQSITTVDFLAYLKANLLADAPDLAARIPIDEWLTKPGIPTAAPRAVSTALAAVEKEAACWSRGEKPVGSFATKHWSTQEWLHFLRSLPEELTADRMKELDAAFGFTRTGNAEIVCQWLQMAIHNRYDAAYPRVEEFLTSVGRRKFLQPLYEELMKTDEGKKMARRIYEHARPGYHSIAVGTVDGIVNGKK